MKKQTEKEKVKTLRRYIEMSALEQIAVSPEKEKKLRKKYNLFDTKNAKHIGNSFSLDMLRYHEKYWGDYGYEDPISISFTDSNFNYILHDIYIDLISCFEFSRLNYIRQLGMVGLTAAYGCADQTRAAHSFIVAVMCDSALTENNFDYGLIKLGIASGLYHDLATTPWSDQGKRMNLEKLNEESMIERVLKNSEQIPAILKKHNISIKDIVNSVRGSQEIVGPLVNSRAGLDLDNIAYLGLDHQCISLEYPFDDIRSFAKSSSKPFDAYRNLKFIDGKWVFTNPEQVRDLLFIRTMMYQRVYHNPWNRAKEAFIGKILRDMNNKGVITYEDMLKLTDFELEKKLEDRIAKGDYKSFFHIFFSQFMEKDREYDLSKFEKLKKKYKNNKNISVYKFKPPRPATDTMILDRGKIVSFEKAYPEHTALIKKVIKTLDYIGIYEKMKTSNYDSPPEKNPFLIKGLEAISKPRIFNKNRNICVE